MKKMLFIRHDNIRRSPMVEYVVEDLVKKAGLESQFRIASAVTSREEVGNPVCPPAQRKLAEHGIGCSCHAARQFVNSDYEKYDLLIGMGQASLWDMYCTCGGDFTDKIHLLLDYMDRPNQEVVDLWYIDNFEATWWDAPDGCQGLLDHLMITQRKREMSMGLDDKTQLLEDKHTRAARDEEKEEWYFSIADVVAVLTDAPDCRAARNYWKVTKKCFVDESFEPVTSCNQLEMTATDGKKRLTDVADTEQLLRVIQSTPLHKAEPSKRWLAGVGRERIEETTDPELTIDRVLETYLKKGYSREWINQCLQAIQVRKEPTDEWDARGVQKGVEYAILTDEISRVWSGMTVRQYKTLKGLAKENLRDNTTILGLVLNTLTEATTTEISEQKGPVTFSGNIKTVRAGGKVAGDAQKVIEVQTGVLVITSKNATQLSQITVDMIEGNVIPSGEDADS